jgi:hypothetical protein
MEVSALTGPAVGRRGPNQNVVDCALKSRVTGTALMTSKPLMKAPAPQAVAGTIGDGGGLVNAQLEKATRQRVRCHLYETVVVARLERRATHTSLSQ